MNRTAALDNTILCISVYIYIYIHFYFLLFVFFFSVSSFAKLAPAFTKQTKNMSILQALKMHPNWMRTQCNMKLAVCSQTYAAMDKGRLNS